jgi:hypothetical protein
MTVISRLIAMLAVIGVVKSSMFLLFFLSQSRLRYVWARWPDELIKIAQNVAQTIFTTLTLEKVAQNVGYFWNYLNPNLVTLCMSQPH